MYEIARRNTLIGSKSPRAPLGSPVDYGSSIVPALLYASRPEWEQFNHRLGFMNVLRHKMGIQYPSFGIRADEREVHCFELQGQDEYGNIWSPSGESKPNEYVSPFALSYIVERDKEKIWLADPAGDTLLVDDGEMISRRFVEGTIDCSVSHGTVALPKVIYS